MVQFIMEQVARKINTCLLSGRSAPGSLDASSFNLFNNTIPILQKKEHAQRGEKAEIQTLSCLTSSLGSPAVPLVLIKLRSSN